ELSRKLLEEDPPMLASAAPSADVALRAVDDRMTPPRPADLAIDLPAFELTDRALAAMTTGSPRELRYAEDGRGDGVGLDPAGGGGSQEARRILADTGLVAGVTPRRDR